MQNVMELTQMPKLTQEEMDTAIAKAVAEAITASEASQEAKIAQAVSEAEEGLKASHKAAMDLEIAKERSKREDISKRLEAAKKKQVPTVLESLTADETDSILQIAPIIQGFSTEKRQAFVDSIASANFQSAIIADRDQFRQTELAARDEIEASKDAIIAEQNDALRGFRRDRPISDAALLHCNGEPDNQKYARIELDGMFEKELGPDGELVAKQDGPTLGIDPESNKPFTPETAAKYLARTKTLFAKPSTPSNAGGRGDKPTAKDNIVPIDKLLSEASTPEEKKALYAAHLAEKAS